MCSNTITKDPTTPQVCHLKCEMSNVFKATIENKTSVTTHERDVLTPQVRRCVPGSV